MSQLSEIYECLDYLYSVKQTDKVDLLSFVEEDVFSYCSDNYLIKMTSDDKIKNTIWGVILYHILSLIFLYKPYY